MSALVFLLCAQLCAAAWPIDQAVMDQFWADTGNWSKGAGSSNDACTWVGDDANSPVVECWFGSILAINLANRNLQGRLRFTGSLDHLAYLDVSNNHFVGNITEIFLMIPTLSTARFGFNQLSGRITNLPPNLNELDISSNQLAFNISSINFPSNLQYLNTQGNPGLWGTFSDSLASCDLIEIRVENLGLGLLSTTLLNKQNLVVAEVPNTGITMNFPRTLQKKLRVLNMCNNNITGNLSWNIFSNPNYDASLKLLDLSGNKLTNIMELPAGNAVGHPLQTLRLTNNSLCFDVGILMTALKQLPQLAVLDISGNRIYGDMAKYVSNVQTIFYQLAVWVYRTETPFQNLLILNASANNLTGKVPSLHLFRALSSVDMSNNALTGALPFYLVHGELRSLAFRNNSLRASPPPERVPSYLRMDFERITEDKVNHLACATITPNQGMTVDVDWLTYFDLSDFCDCLPLFVYSFPQRKCIPCPNHTVCGTDIVSNLTAASTQRFGAVARGFYPVGIEGVFSRDDPAGPNRPVLLRCRHSELCNPDSPPPGGEFQCEPGHDINSMLCSRCEVDYFSVLDVCYECAPAAILSPIATVIFLIILTLTVLRKQSRDGFEAGTVQIVLTWVQVTRILSEVHTRRSTGSLLGGDMVFPALYSISVLAPVSIECSLGYIDYESNLMIVFFAPLLFLCYAALVAFIASTCVRMWQQHKQRPLTTTTTTTTDEPVSPPPSCLQNWATRTIFLWGFCLFAFYFQFCLVMLRAVSCEDLVSDPAVDRSALPYPEYTLSVLTNAPFVRCDQDLDISPLGGFGIVFALLFPPSVVASVLFVRKKNPDKWQLLVAPYLGFLTRHLRSEAFLWDMTMVPLRKLLLAIAIACYPRQGPGAVYMPLHVIGVLIICVLAQTWVRPYKTWFDNALEMFLLAEQLLAFFLVVLTSVGEGFFRESDLVGVEGFVVFMTWASTTICILAVLRPLIGTCLGKNKVKLDAAKMTEVEAREDGKEVQSEAEETELASSHAHRA